MTNKTNIHNFGSYSNILSVVASATGTISYDKATYESAMRMTAQELEDARYESQDARKTVRAAILVAIANRGINEWRAR